MVPYANTQNLYFKFVGVYKTHYSTVCPSCSSFILLYFVLIFAQHPNIQATHYNGGWTERGILDSPWGFCDHGRFCTAAGLRAIILGCCRIVMKALGEMLHIEGRYSIGQLKRRSSG